MSADDEAPAGYRILAGPYTPAEQWMLDNVLADLRRGRIEHKLIATATGALEVWRTASGWREEESGQLSADKVEAATFCAKAERTAQVGEFVTWAATAPGGSAP